jgi:hypothetical protein
MTYEIDTRIINNCIIKPLEDFGTEFLGETKKRFINVCLYLLTTKREIPHLRHLDYWRCKYISDFDKTELIDIPRFSSYFNNLKNIENIEEAYPSIACDIRESLELTAYYDPDDKMIKTSFLNKIGWCVNSQKNEDLFVKIVLKGVKDFFQQREAALLFDTLYGLQTPDGSTDIPVYLIAKIINFETGLKWSP